MADFDIAYAPLRVAEGGYVNDPDDPGGETYAGISRRNFPNWSGWCLVDKYKTTIDGRLARDLLAPLVRNFYYCDFWDRICGDRLDSQAIADECFECAVNVGIRPAVKWLQRALNICNDDERHWCDLIVDGVVGPSTVSAVEHSERTNRYRYVVRVQNILQGAHYVALMEHNKAREKWIGWIDRARPAERIA